MVLVVLTYCLHQRLGTTRAEDAQGTPTQSHIPPSILEYTKITVRVEWQWQVLLWLSQERPELLGVQVTSPTARRSCYEPIT